MDSDLGYRLWLRFLILVVSAISVYMGWYFFFGYAITTGIITIFDIIREIKK